MAAATDACLGDGHVSLAVADKNLVPSPPGNIARALEPLRGLPGAWQGAQGAGVCSYIRVCVVVVGGGGVWHGHWEGDVAGCNTLSVPPYSRL